MPRDICTEKYADDIVCYILGLAEKARHELPQRVVDAVQLWCSDNQMFLNGDKCKLIHFAAKKAEQPPRVTIVDSKSSTSLQLEVVPCYKYLGIDLTSTLDSNVYWERIAGSIRQNIYLLKQLKCSGLEELILVTVFKSLVLSVFRYGSVVVDSCTQQAKSDMQVIQNRMLRIIGLHATHLILDARQLHKCTP